jgi:hypothetical protein
MGLQARAPLPPHGLEDFFKSKGEVIKSSKPTSRYTSEGALPFSLIRYRVSCSFLLQPAAGRKMELFFKILFKRVQAPASPISEPPQVHVEVKVFVHEGFQVYFPGSVQSRHPSIPKWFSSLSESPLSVSGTAAVRVRVAVITRTA